MPIFSDLEIDKIKKEMGQGIVADYKQLQNLSDHSLLALIATILLQDKRNLVTANDFRR
jgi:hypothetical protein